MTDERRANKREALRRFRAANPGYSEQKYQEWKDRNGDSHARKRKNSNLKVYYGITLDQWNAMLEAQGGRCKICGEVLGGTPATDHCHVTKKVRGLLCSNCNTGLGMFKDNPDLLFRAAEYITESRS